MNRKKQIEESFINKLIELKYTYREDIRDRDTLACNKDSHKDGSCEIYTPKQFIQH